MTVEVECSKCGHVMVLEKHPGLYAEIPPCPKCGAKGHMGHKLKEKEK